MLFDYEAIKGIYDALPVADKMAVEDRCIQRNAYVLTQFGTPERAEMVFDVLVDLGHIMLMPRTPCDAGAEEYEEAIEAMNALALIGD